MLKSTYKSAASDSVPSLPEGWTEHRAPTGHTYYYNAGTKISTYTRPQSSPVQIGTQQLPEHATSLTSWSTENGELHVGPSYETPGLQRRPFQKVGQRPQHRDRPKSKVQIPDSEPWILVKTRLGRRFVFNPDQNQSFWKFPPDVLRGVVELDRQEREKRQKVEDSHVETEGEGVKVPTAAALPLAQKPPNDGDDFGSGSEYEEVEVTDDEGQEDQQMDNEMQRTEADQPVEFDEDDIAFQLQAMGQEYELEPEEYGQADIDDNEEDGGLSLTEQDAKALFVDMLNDLRINPFTTWDALIDAGHIVEDDRYTVLSNMRSRKEVWTEWTRDKIQHLKEQRELEAKKDPKIPYFSFLEARATPKLYWQEFRRKYQREPEMRNTKLTDKDREKWYRDYINRIKLPESNLKTDFIQLLKSLPIHVLNNSVTLESLPPVLLTDMRFISLRKSIRDPLVETFIKSLPPAPPKSDLSPQEMEAMEKQTQERERRQTALAERQRRVEEEKRKQKGALRQGREMLREGEDEVARAMDVGKQGLMSHMYVDNSV